MAGFEDTDRNGTFLEGREVKVEKTGLDAAGDLIPITGTRLESHKKVGANTDPLRCTGAGAASSNSGGRCNIPAAIKVNFHGEERPRTMCDFHWGKVSHLTDKFDPYSIQELTAQPEDTGGVRFEDWQIRNAGDMRDAAEVAESTGIVRDKKTPGRPVVPHKDNVSTVIDAAAARGGRNFNPVKKHINNAHKALLHSISENEGTPHYGTYAAKAVELGVPEEHVGRYYDIAMDKESKAKKAAVVPRNRNAEIESLQQDVVFNPTLGESEEDKYKGLMQPDIPSASESGAAGISRFDDQAFC